MRNQNRPTTQGPVKPIIPPQTKPNNQIAQNSNEKAVREMLISLLR